jgi:hypothetical protein
MDEILSRRRLLRLACCCGCAGYAGVPSETVATTKLTKACLLTEQGFKVYRSQGYAVHSLGENVFDQRRATKTTGRPDIDRELHRSIQTAAAILKVNPAFGFFEPDRFLGEDELEATNAFAWGRTLVPGTSGTVAFGMSRFRTELYGYDESGNRHDNSSS